MNSQTMYAAKNRAGYLFAFHEMRKGAISEAIATFMGDQSDKATPAERARLWRACRRKTGVTIVRVAIKETK